MPKSGSAQEVINQSPLLGDVNLYTSDRALQEAVEREGAAAWGGELDGFGALAGRNETFELGRLANENLPRLRTHDRQGRRLDVVDYHPAYHALMQMSCANGLHAAVWDRLGPGSAGAAGANVGRGAKFYMMAQAEAGHCCPITMTSASVPTLMQEPRIAEALLPKLLVRGYDARPLPLDMKRSITLGMGMTERQGGTDVRANTTRAEPVGRRGSGEEYRLDGHKWFLSAPMSDAFLVLAQAPGGLTCFLVPRVLDGGEFNGLRLQRLKDKLGNRSNGSTEVEFDGCHGWAVGEEGRGVATIIEMVTHTRLDCALASAGLMRLSLAHAIHHTTYRRVFGRRLVDEPLMIEVLADLAVETEAAVALSFRLARAFDHAGDERADAWRRLMTPVTKFYVCKVAPGVVGEAMECLGGNGYVEELPIARAYREAPVNAIWEGSGNVMALDVLRVLQKEPGVAELVMDELGRAAGDDPHLKAAHRRIETILQEPRLLDLRARALVEGLAVLAAGTVLRSHAPQAVADAYVATRMGQSPHRIYGQGLDWAETRAIVARAAPDFV